MPHRGFSAFNYKGVMILRVIIAGSRDFDDYNKAKPVILEVFRDLKKEGYNTKQKNVLIISGGAKGADNIGETFAKQYKISYQVFKPDWNNIDAPGAVIKENKYGKYNAKAGHDRNNSMAKCAANDMELGVLLAFWDGKSTGTKNMIATAQKHNLRVFLVDTNEVKLTK